MDGDEEGIVIGDPKEGEVGAEDIGDCIGGCELDAELGEDGRNRSQSASVWAATAAVSAERKNVWVAILETNI